MEQYAKTMAKEAEKKAQEAARLHIGEDLQCVHYGFGVRLGRVQSQQGHLICYSLLGLLPKGLPKCSK